MLELNKIHNMDCLDGLKMIPKKSIDLIIIDPPYSTPVITAFGRKKEKNIGDLSIQKHFFIHIKKEFERILKEQKAVFVFCDSKYYPILFEVFFDWQTNQLLIWDKKRIGMGSPFRKQYELIYFVSPDYGLHFMNGKSYADIIKCEVVPSEKRIHGSQKPLKLIKELISAFTKEGDTVLDCFMGSGTTAIASLSLKRNYIGMDINEDYINDANKRIEKIMKQKTVGVFTPNGVGELMFHDSANAPSKDLPSANPS